MKKEIKFKDGLSESAWKSLVVKSLRIGWVNGLEKASEKLSKSEMTNLLLCGLFEDVFPAGYDELEQAYKEILSFDFTELCQRQTHHGRNYTNKFCELETQAVTRGKVKFTEMLEKLKKHTSIKWINYRIANCLYTWFQIQPNDRNEKRDSLNMKWNGMPLNILDSHTYEGRRNGAKITLLSGHYENHFKIGEEVMNFGWDRLREKFRNDAIVNTEQTLF